MEERAQERRGSFAEVTYSNIIYREEGSHKFAERVSVGVNMPSQPSPPLRPRYIVSPSEVNRRNLNLSDVTVTTHREVMRSMERPYAMPSEKLRVWMAWLTGIGEIVDEWHKWLRAHFDLITRIAEMAANDETPGGRKIESVVSSNVISLYR